MGPKFTVPSVASTGEEQGLLSVADLSKDDFWHLVRRSCTFFDDPAAHDRPLEGKTFGTLFTKTSTRTRTAFSTGILKLAGGLVGFGSGDLQTNTGESWVDTGRVLGSMVDGLVARTTGPLADLRVFARVAGIPVVNAMATEEHPTQAVCDVAALMLCAEGRDLTGLRVLYVGEGNNTAVALAHALAFVPDGHVTFACPPGYGLPSDEFTAAARRARAVGGSLAQVSRRSDISGEFHAVYTTRWQTTGTQKNDPAWKEKFRRFHVDESLMNRWPDAVFLHDLPAHRGEEVMGAVLDGPRSIAWTQARMKFASAMAILEWVTQGPTAS
jgi:ornithine carbamoyltransferase